MSKKILIIEDEEYLVDMYKVKFESAGYEIIVARDGELGLALARSEQPDLILLDIVIPKKDGYEVLEELRSDEEIKDLKVYILSNLGQKAEIKKGLADGADGYFVKANLTPQQLVENVKRIFSKEKEREDE